MESRLLFIIVLLGLISCGKDKKLPHLGPKSVNEAGDTVYFSIPPFEATNQDGEIITNKSLKGNVYVSEFFFTSCPTICPVMTGQLLRVHEKFKNEDRLKIVSYTLDPEYDTPAKLQDHAQRLGIDTNQWWFLNDKKSETYELAQKGYFVTALEDSTQPGGIVHSGKVSLIDGKGHIRGYYDGTVEADVNVLINDIATLLAE